MLTMPLLFLISDDKFTKWMLLASEVSNSVALNALNRLSLSCVNFLNIFRDFMLSIKLRMVTLIYEIIIKR
jgi:hypothetical protein